MKKYLYAIAMGASRPASGAYVLAAYALCKNEFEAIGLGVREAEKKWLPRDGYHSHFANVAQVEDDFIRQAMQGIKGERDC